MTISSPINRNDHSGDGNTTIFPYNFIVLQTTDMTVFLDGVEQTTDFTVEDVGNPAGGTVTFSVAPTLDVEISLIRQVAFVQETDYTAFDAFPAETHESALDYLTMQTQQLNEVISRPPVGNGGNGNGNGGNGGTPGDVIERTIPLHINTATTPQLRINEGASSTTPSSLANNLVIEGGGSVGLSILGTTNQSQYIHFGSGGVPETAHIFWSGVVKVLFIGTNHASGQMVFSTGNNIDAVLITASQAIDFAVSALSIGGTPGVTGSGTNVTVVKGIVTAIS